MDKPDEQINVVVLMGVSGAGKTTIGQFMAERLNWEFYDGDDFHPKENVTKMGSGKPLNDTDRGPWLQAIRELISNVLEDDRSAVVACSALKKAYRERIMRDNDGAIIVYLKGDREMLQRRMEEREGHYMRSDMLASQFRTLEPPESDERVITVSVDKSPDAIVEKICAVLSLEDAPAGS